MAFSPRLISRRLLSSLSFAHTIRMSTATAPTESVISPSKIHKKTSPFSSSPWLMLPPTYNDGTGSIGYNFYSLAENRVLTQPQMTGLTGLMPNPIHDLRFRGSSHGWMVMFNPHSLDLFLYNPVSLRHIKLPPIHNLPNFPKDNIRGVTKVILSSSPDEDNCRAVMMYNCISAVAFCCPGRSEQWTPIGKTHQMCYDDIVYSSRRNLLFGLNQDSELETWDLNDTSSPRMIKMIKTDDDEYYDHSPPKHKDLCWPVEYLVVADELFSDDEDDVLLVTRYVMEQVAPDGSCIDYCTLSELYPYTTIDFDIAVYDEEEGDLKGPVESLGDLTLFVGSTSDSVALSATRFPELKPNSIYFSDPHIETRVEDTDELFGGHDIGIFNYENKTLSPCYYPCDVQNLKRIVPSPMWFFPTC